MAAPEQAASWRLRLARESLQWLFFNLPRSPAARWRAMLRTALALGPDGARWLLSLPRFAHWQRTRAKSSGSPGA
jgi:hypothetical protein